MLARAERLQSQFFHIHGSVARQPVWEPPVDVLETRGYVHILVGLPGVDPDTIGARIDGGALIVVGDRSLPVDLEEALIHRIELPRGRFERRVRLPAGRYDDMQWASENGCLIVTLSKAI